MHLGKGKQFECWENFDKIKNLHCKFVFRVPLPSHKSLDRLKCATISYASLKMDLKRKLQTPEI